MNTAYRISLIALAASGVGFIVGIAIFVNAFNEADLHPPGHATAESLTVLISSTAFGVLALISTIVTALNRRSS